MTAGMDRAVSCIVGAASKHRVVTAKCPGHLRHAYFGNNGSTCGVFLAECALSRAW